MKAVPKDTELRMPSSEFDRIMRGALQVTADAAPKRKPDPRKPPARTTKKTKTKP